MMNIAIRLAVLYCLAVVVRCQPANFLSEVGGGTNSDIPADVLAVIGSSILGGPIEGGTVEWPILGGAGAGELFTDGLRNGWDGNPAAIRGAGSSTAGSPVQRPTITLPQGAIRQLPLANIRPPLLPPQPRMVAAWPGDNIAVSEVGGGTNSDIPADVLAVIGSSILGGPIEGGTVEWPILGGAGAGELFTDGLRNGWDGNPVAIRGAGISTAGSPMQRPTITLPQGAIRQLPLANIPPPTFRGHVSWTGGVIRGVPNVPVVPEVNSIHPLVSRGVTANTRGLINSVETQAQAVILGQPIYRHDSAITGPDMSNPTHREIQTMSIQQRRAQMADLYRDLTTQLTTGQLRRTPAVVPLSHDPFSNDPGNPAPLRELARRTGASNTVRVLSQAIHDQSSISIRPLIQTQAQSHVQIAEIVPPVRQGARISRPNFHRNPAFDSIIPRKRHFQNQQHASAQNQINQVHAQRSHLRTIPTERLWSAEQFVQRPANIPGIPLLQTGGLIRTPPSTRTGVY